MIENTTQDTQETQTATRTTQHRDKTVKIRHGASAHNPTKAEMSTFRPGPRLNRQKRRVLKRLESHIERKMEKKKRLPTRCPVCYRLSLGPARDRCQCKVKAQEYRYNPD